MFLQELLLHYFLMFPAVFDSIRKESFLSRFEMFVFLSFTFLIL